MIHLRLGKGGRRVDVTFAESTGEAKATPSLTKATTGSAHDPKPATKARDQGQTEPPPPEKYVGFLLAGLTSVIALLTTLGAVTGGLERMFRNYPKGAGISLLLVLLGTAGIVLALALKWDNPASGSFLKFWESRTRLIVASTLVFIVGVGL